MGIYVYVHTSKKHNREVTIAQTGEVITVGKVKYWIKPHWNLWEEARDRIKRRHPLTDKLPNVASWYDEFDREVIGKYCQKLTWLENYAELTEYVIIDRDISGGQCPYPTVWKIPGRLLNEWYYEAGDEWDVVGVLINKEVVEAERCDQCYNYYPKESLKDWYGRKLCSFKTIKGKSKTYNCYGAAVSKGTK